MAIVDNAFREWIADFKAANPSAADSRAILDTAQYAFAAGRKAQREIDAARQPDTAHAAYHTGKAIGRREAELEAAARQPVGEPVGEKLMRLLRERAALPESVELSYQRDGDGTGRAWWDRRHAELEAQGYSLDFETDSGAEWYTLRGIGDELRAALAEYDTAPPAQAVDLGQFRPAVELMEWQERGHANPDFPRGDAKKHAEALRLLALIESHTAGGQP